MKESNELLERESPPTSEVHPVLRRHYSTIGIGDVFVEVPCSAGCLPSSYLDASHSCPAGALSTEMLWEMIGTIKSTPEDFLVREVAFLVGRGLQVADLSLASGLRQADIKMPHRSDDVAATDNQPIDAKSALVEIAAFPDVKEPLQNNDDAGESYKDATERLQAMLAKHLCINSSIASLTPQSPSVTLAALQKLALEALDTIKNMDGNFVQNSSTSQLLITISFTVLSADTLQQKKERGDIHEAIRHSFPLLRSEAANVETSTDGLYHIRVTVDDHFFGLVPYLYDPVDDLSSLYGFFKRGYEYAQKQIETKAQCCRGLKKKQSRNWRERQSRNSPILRLKPNLQRSDRRHVHQTIESKSKGMLGTETWNDYLLHPSDSDTTTAIAVHWTNVAARRMSKKRTRDESNAGPITKFSYRLCVLRKRQKEHLAMINTLSAGLRCRSADIGLAGRKDMHAVTYQFCTLSDIASKRIHASVEYLKQRGIEIAMLHKVDRALGKGDLVGNHFEIVVRNLRRVQLTYTNNTVKEAFVRADKPHLEQMVDRIRREGFVNFFGEQRVGDPGHESIVGVRAFDIGRAMLQQDFSKAIDLIITGRRLVHGFVVEGDDVDLFRQTWKSTNGDPVSTAKNLPQCGSSAPRERMVLKGLIRYGKDNPLAAFKCLQRNDQLFFIHAVRHQRPVLLPHCSWIEPND